MPSREVRVAIIGDPSSLQRALRSADAGVNQFGAKMQAFGSRMQAAGRTMTRGLTLPILAFGYVAARELSSSERALAQTEAVIESTGRAAGKSVQDIVDLSSALSEMSSVDDEAIQEMANTLLTFRSIAGDTFDEATEATLDMSIALDRDLRSTAIMVGKALNDPVAGMYALGRAGVQFNDEFRNTGYTMREAIEWMVEMGDTAGAQQIILSELNQEFGGSAQALGETLTGRLQRAKNKFEELSAEVLADLIPVFESLMGVVDDLAGAFDRLTPRQQEMVAWGLLALAILGPLTTVIGGLTSVIGGLSGVLGGLGAALGVGAGLAGALVLSIIALAGSLIYAAMNWDAVTAALGSFLSLANNIPGVRTAVDAVRQAVQWATVAVGFLIEKIQQLAMLGLDALRGAVALLTGDINGALASANSLVTRLSEAFTIANNTKTVIETTPGPKNTDIGGAVGPRMRPTRTRSRMRNRGPMPVFVINNG